MATSTLISVATLTMCLTLLSSHGLKKLASVWEPVYSLTPQFSTFPFPQDSCTSPFLSLSDMFGEEEQLIQKLRPPISWIGFSSTEKLEFSTKLTDIFSTVLR